MIDNWFIIILFSVCISAVLTAVIIPQVLDVAYKKQLFDNPDYRKVHKGVVPRLGGFAFLPAVLCSISVVVGFEMFISPKVLENSGVILELPKILVLFASVSLLYLIGLKDDLVDVKYRSKFVVQGICAFMTVFSGVYIVNLQGLFWIWSMPWIVQILLSAFIIIFIINAINLIDGIDGLASGICIVSLILFGTFFFMVGKYLYAMLAWTVVGTLSAFFYFNLFGNNKRRRKIFMGDTGALTMGIIIAFLAIEITGIDMTQASLPFNAVVVAIAPLIIPLFDVVRVFFHRLKAGRSPFLPDKCHIHHNLMSAGFSPLQTLLFILSFQIVLTIVNVWLSACVNICLLIGADILCYILVNLLIPKKSQPKTC